MLLDNTRPFDGGPAYPGVNQEIHLPPDDNRPFQVVQQPMNGMSIRDVATLQILSALIAARCSITHNKISPAVSIPSIQLIKHEWIIEAMDAADTWLEMREQV